MASMPRASLIVLFGILATAPMAHAQDEDPFALFRAEAQVVTPRRGAQAYASAPAGVDVIDAAEIRASGAVDLWDVLRLRPGLELSEGRSVDGNRAAVSIRGGQGEFVNDLLVLVDGRSVLSQSIGGVFWDDIPVPIEAIARVEIVRGANSAFYGANAARGVVNIITKVPTPEPRAVASVRGGSRGLLRAAEEASGGRGTASARVHHEFLQEDGRPSASAASASDFRAGHKIFGRASWTGGALRLDASAGGIFRRSGVNFAPPHGYGAVDHFSMLRASSGEETGSGRWELTASGRQADSRVTLRPEVSLRERQYDGEAFYAKRWLGERLRTAVGLGHRSAEIESPVFYEGAPSQLQRVTRAYLHQSAKLDENLELAGAASMESSDTGGVQVNRQAEVLLSPVPEHGLRLSYAVSHTVPPLFKARSNYLSSPAVRLVGNPDLKPVSLETFEAGWRGNFLENRLRPKLTGYYQQADGVHDNRTLEGVPQRVSGVNDGREIVRGVELAAHWSFEPRARITAQYAFEHARGRRDLPGSSGETPAHKAALSAWVDLPRRMQAWVALSYKDAYSARSATRSTTLAAPAHWRLDGRLSWRPREGLELFAGGRELLDDGHREFPDGLSVERTLYGGVSLSFGTGA